MCVGWAAQPRTFVGSAKCAACHPEEFRRQAASEHAKALVPAAQHPLASSFATGAVLHRSPAYDYRFSLQGGQLAVRVVDPANFLDIPIQWAFGAGAQAVTFISLIDRDWYLEHYFTYYGALGAMGITPGQQDRVPASLADAAGLVYKSRDPATGIVKCFACHSTGPVDISHAAIEPGEAGVRCESCHGPGSLHAQTADPRLISNPGKMPPAQLNVFCGRCHRPPEEPAGQIDWNFAWNVRHQPSYLSQSACFRRSKGALSCLTCHRPHESLEGDITSYNRVCGSCHRSAHTQADRTNCIDCHMPLVSPQPPLRFTNHWIGVYGPGAKLKPVASRR
ncbi:MAG TPA: multiheme c-type cytochrome [Bryobacteraceae bacterium]